MLETNFVAFVQTKLLPFVSLELGTVKPEETGTATLTFSEVTTTRIREGGPEEDFEKREDRVRTDETSLQLHKKSETGTQIIFEIVGGSASVSERYDWVEIRRHQKRGACEYNETLEDHYVLSGSAPAVGRGEGFGVGVFFSPGNVYAIGSASQYVEYGGTETWTARYEFLSPQNDCRTDVTDVTQKQTDSSVSLEEQGTVDPNNPKVLSGSRTVDLGEGRTRTITWTLIME